MTARVSADEVQRVAELAHLELEPQESGRIEQDLNAILDYIDQLNELDTTGVEPLAQINELINELINEQISEQIDRAASGLDRTACGSSLRADAVRPSLDRAKVMSQAPECDGVFFKVPKVIER